MSGLRVSRSRFLFNRAQFGGALGEYHGTEFIEDSYFEGNEAESGGAFSIVGGKVFPYCEPRPEHPQGRPGCSFASAQVRNCTFLRNRATGDGAVVNVLLNAGLRIEDSLVSGNEAGGAGGAVFFDSGAVYPLEIFGTILEGNSAQRRVAGVLCSVV